MSKKLKPLTLPERPKAMWIECRGYEVLYYIKGLNVEPNVALADTLGKQLSYTRLLRYSEEYEAMGKLLAAMATPEDMAVNEANMVAYFANCEERLKTLKAYNDHQ